MAWTRRSAFGLLGTAGAAPLLAGGGEARAADCAAPEATWARGVEGQRKADLGDGLYLNPIMAGDHPDPSILRDGDVWYMTFSSFESVPGLVIWRSHDLVNWSPVTAALTRNIGSVWAPELCKHAGRFHLYIPARTAQRRTIWVAWADRIEGPWSDPVDLNLPDHIDPGHAVGDDGKRYLFLSGGDLIGLSEDGLSTVGAVRHVYDPWRYPADWDVESFSPEGPKITRRGDWYYMITAVGGTAGPPTSHMVIVARSKSVFGPWEDHPDNPLIRTKDRSERWWSKGHATVVEGPAGDWWMVYHAYENGYWTLGRQTLLEPIRWRADGWPEAGADPAAPITAPRGGRPVAHGAALSDNFSSERFGTQWSFPDPGPDDRARFACRDGVLHLKAAGRSPKDGPPITFVQGEQAYQIEVDVEIDPGTTAGVVLFYDRALYAGLGFDGERFVTHQYGLERGRPANPHGRRMRLRMTNDRHVVTFHHSGDDGATWTKFDRQMEVSGYHHNVRGGFMMLRPGLYAAGEGEARFRDFRFRALP
ncbi:family 43 glycosylhydrolase [Brevundimonas sp. Root1279]|uniref:family 43 glycosylhydrolase n=1 Tax=Brevundimonas sp. Root1279 TaxID=1736443 RepID=UPI0006F7D0F6|nr:family 43 glycosylhydrolase [Brevundimonas sp. Root1279]KQW86338.1 xylan 1,4-beta-xylosidase [Brevundimonas sp. Root1279]